MMPEIPGGGGRVRRSAAAFKRRVALSSHFRDPGSRPFLARQRSDTTILFGGLSPVHDRLIEAGLHGLGYLAHALPVPDEESLRLGREYGNRGQCNPAHFTAGNLVKYLLSLRDEHGVTLEQLQRSHVFATAGACGPCRFGCYATEYRRALREVGFDEFRVISLQQQAGVAQRASQEGLQVNLRFFFYAISVMVLGDVLNALGQQLRPYEVHPGETDAAIEQTLQHCCTALEQGRSLLRAARSCRCLFASIEVDRLLIKPRVVVTGEFWATTTRGDGNYHLVRLLEAEGAEVEMPALTQWWLYLIWQNRFDIRRRRSLRVRALPRNAGKSSRRRLIELWLVEKLFTSAWHRYSRALGYERRRLPDMERLARISHPFYNCELRGGEGHLEVATLLQAACEGSAHLVLSVKPFGCLPSSGVSDGIQMVVTTRHPEVLFCSIETTGTAAAGVESRLQMMLFKAREKAQQEMEREVERRGVSLSAVRARLAESPRWRQAQAWPRARGASTAVNLYRDVVSSSWCRR